MKNNQRGETRRNNDIIKAYEDLSFNLGIVEKNNNEVPFEIKPDYKSPKRVSAFNVRLNKLLKERKVNKTQFGKDLAIMTGRKAPIARQTIDAYARGKSSPTLDIVLAICEYFGISCDYLVGLENNITKEDKYISEVLGLTQESINYLKSQKRCSDNIEKENLHKREMLYEYKDLEEREDTLKSKEKRKFDRLKEDFILGKLDEKKSTDKILNVINLLIEDMIASEHEKSNKTCQRDRKGNNILKHLSEYLNVDEIETLVAFDYIHWKELAISINDTINELNSVKRDQKINYYREKVTKLKATYNDAIENLQENRFTKNARLIVYMNNLEISLKKFRKQLDMKSGE